MISTLNSQIQQFYDASSGLWEQIWGEHMHHGYYGSTGQEKKDRRHAQIDLIEELLKWAQVDQSAWATSGNSPHILDVGCGIGGSSLYLAQKYNATAIGITLSPVQASRATERAKEAGLATDVQFQVADALEMPFADDTFDFVWSMESGEHMPDKEKFLAECYRVLKPRGTFLMATWCHRPITAATGELTANEKQHLAEIYRVYCLPHVISIPEYEAIAHHLPFHSNRTADWSDAVAPFWDIVIDSAFEPKAIFGLLQSGWSTVQGALSLGLMSRGYRRGLVRYGLLCANK
jgi:tocopherol O-methyltransferase